MEGVGIKLTPCVLHTRMLIPPTPHHPNTTIKKKVNTSTVVKIRVTNFWLGRHPLGTLQGSKDIASTLQEARCDFVWESKVFQDSMVTLSILQDDHLQWNPMVEREVVSPSSQSLPFYRRPSSRKSMSDWYPAMASKMWTVGLAKGKTTNQSYHEEGLESP